MSDGFTKLFSSITDSTIWAEDSDTRVVWITMLAMADATGYVGASIPGLAARARVSVEVCEAALEKFLAPDHYSRSQEHEGRRIEIADRGWMLLNYGRFRAERSAEKRREWDRERKRKEREDRKKRDESGQMRTDADVPPISAQAEAEAEEETTYAPNSGALPSKRKPSKPTWLTPYIEAWKQSAGEPAVKELAARMKPIEVEIGPERAVLALTRWLEAGNAKFGAANFARAWREWDDDPTKVIETYLPNGEINPVVRAAFEQGARARGGR